MQQPKKENLKKKERDKTPMFEFYLYNDAGRIIRQYLSIHEIQQILLQQSQNFGNTSIKEYNTKSFSFLGLKQLGWLIGRNDSSWFSSQKSTTVYPKQITISKEDLLSTVNSKVVENTTKSPSPSDMGSKVLGMIGKIQGIVASVQKNNKKPTTTKLECLSNDY